MRLKTHLVRTPAGPDLSGVTACGEPFFVGQGSAPGSGRFEALRRIGGLQPVTTAKAIRTILAALDALTPTPTDEAVRGLVERLEEGARDLHPYSTGEVESPHLNVALPAYLTEAAALIRSQSAEIARLQALTPKEGFVVVSWGDLDLIRGEAARGQVPHPGQASLVLIQERAERLLSAAPRTEGTRHD